MAIEIFDLELEEGADYDDTVTWENDGGAVNLTGCTASLRISVNYGDTPILTLTEVDGISLGGTTGTIRTQVSKSRIVTVKDAIAAANATEAKYQLEITFTDDTTERYRQGAVTVDPRA